MTGVTTGQTALPTATDSDDSEHFLAVDLTTALQALANLFESATGHDHSGSGKGKPIGSAGIASGIHLVGPVVDSGGLTVTVGNVGVGVAAIANRGIFVNGAITSNSGVGALIGIDDNPTLTAQANNDALYGVQVFPAYGLNSKTGVKAVGIEIPSQAYANAPNAVAVEVGAPTGTGTNNYGVFIGVPSGASGQNESLNAQGSVSLAANTGYVHVGNASGSVGFYGSSGVVKQTITGSRAGNAALASLLTNLAALGLIIDSTTA